MNDRLTLRPLTSYTIRKIEWLDKPFLQRSAFHLLAGRKGTCKGTWICGLAARVSRADLFPEPRSILVVTSEDSVSVDFMPRFIAANGDPAKVKIVCGPFRLPGDLDWLKAQALEIGDVGLIVVDPIGNHLGGGDTDKEGVVREAIGPLNELADDLDTMVVGVRHLGKNSSRGALSSVLGSTAWVDVPRAVIVMAADDEDDRLFHAAVVAGNRGPRGAARALRLTLVSVPPQDEVPLVVAEGESNKDIEALLETKSSASDGSRSGRAREIILDILERDGRQESDSLDARVALEAGIAAKTVKNIRSSLKDAGLIKPEPEKDEHGKVVQWFVRRTNAPRGGAN